MEQGNKDVVTSQSRVRKEPTREQKSVTESDGCCGCWGFKSPEAASQKPKNKTPRTRTATKSYGGYSGSGGGFFSGGGGDYGGGGGYFSGGGGDYGGGGGGCGGGGGDAGGCSGGF